jgi:iron-sulfur cluster insertion protein
MINVSPNAAEKIAELLNEEGKVGSGLRVFVQGGGCSGFQYGLMIEEAGGQGDCSWTRSASATSRVPKSISLTP